MKNRRFSLTLYSLIAIFLASGPSYAGDLSDLGEATRSAPETGMARDLGLHEVKEGHPIQGFLNPEFLGFGIPYEFDVPADLRSCKRGRTVIMSAKVPHEMSQYNAEEFCRGIHARLPSKKEFLILADLMGASDSRHDDWQGYNPDLIPDMKGQKYWTSSIGQWRGVWDYFFWRQSLGGVFNRMSAYVFDGDGKPGDLIFWENYRSVRCAVTVRYPSN